MAHHALLLAINTYPGLTNLEGPENDVEDFREWLEDVDGGNVPPGNIAVIKSSQFPAPTDRYDAHPAEIEFRRALSRLLYEPDGVTFRDRVGERLYLFFAGHGFASRRMSEAALYTAQAARNDPDHIASKRYMERIRHSAAFDEIVLVMDCCRDVDLSDSIREPTMKIPDRQALAGHVRVLEAYAAGRGQQAREQIEPATGRVRGMFTKALLDALREARGDEQGRVTGTVLKGHVHQHWPARFNGSPVTFEPEISPPAGANDLVLVTRAGRARAQVLVHGHPPVPAGTQVVVYQGGQEIRRAPLAIGGTILELDDNYYKLVLDSIPGRSAMIDTTEASWQEVTL